MIENLYAQPHSELTVISRPLKGIPIGKHIGVLIGSYVFEFIKGKGLNITDLEGFQQGKKIAIEEKITNVALNEAYERIQTVSSLNYNVLFFNCETFAKFVSKKTPISTQSVLAITAIGFTTYVIFSRKRVA